MLPLPHRILLVLAAFLQRTPTLGVEVNCCSLHSRLWPCTNICVRSFAVALAVVFAQFFVVASMCCLVSARRRLDVSRRPRGFEVAAFTSGTGSLRYSLLVSFARDCARVPRVPKRTCFVDAAGITTMREQRELALAVGLGGPRFHNYVRVEWRRCSVCIGAAASSCARRD